jgi:hypothetical protein
MAAKSCNFSASALISPGIVRPSILQSIFRQVYNLFQSEFSIERNLVQFFIERNLVQFSIERNLVHFFIERNLVQFPV